MFTGPFVFARPKTKRNDEEAAWCVRREIPSFFDSHRQTAQAASMAFNPQIGNFSMGVGSDPMDVALGRFTYVQELR
jgi:hypothetical protein